MTLPSRGQERDCEIILFLSKLRCIHRSKPISGCNATLWSALLIPSYLTSMHLLINPTTPNCYSLEEESFCFICISSSCFKIRHTKSILCAYMLPQYLKLTIFSGPASHANHIFLHWELSTRDSHHVSHGSLIA